MTGSPIELLRGRSRVIHYDDDKRLSNGPVRIYRPSKKNPDEFVLVKEITDIKLKEFDVNGDEVDDKTLKKKKTHITEYRKKLRRYKCEDCGVEATSLGHNSVRCVECQKKHAKYLKKLDYEKSKNKR